MDTHGLYPAFFAWLSENGLDAYALSTNQILIYLEKFCCENKGKIEANIADIAELNYLLADKVSKYAGAPPLDSYGYAYGPYHNKGGGLKEGYFLFSPADFEFKNNSVAIKDNIARYPTVDTSNFKFIGSIGINPVRHDYMIFKSSDFDLDFSTHTVSLKQAPKKLYQHFVVHNEGQHAFSWIDSSAAPHVVCDTLAGSIIPGAQMYGDGSGGILKTVTYDAERKRYIFTAAAGLVTAVIDKTAEVTDTVTEL